jgi:phosphonate transport system ATP-binding protein
MSLLTVNELSKMYGNVQALSDVNFSVSEGEFVVLLGISGAGKSTLLRCLNGLSAPTAGTINLSGRSVTRSRDDIGMIFQQHNLVEGMSAYKNALTGSLSRTGFLRALFGRQDADDKLRAIEALDTVGLYDQCQQPVRELSGGQQQRVGIARALVQQPQLLLADEPVASLDPASAETVMKCLKRVSVEEGLTTITSLHQVNIARQFGDRFIGLRDGRVVFDAGPEELTIDRIDEIYDGLDKSVLSSHEAEPMEVGQ